MHLQDVVWEREIGECCLTNNAASSQSDGSEINPSPRALQQTFLCLKEGEREEIYKGEVQKQLLSCHWWLFSQLLSWADEDPKRLHCSNNCQQFYGSFWSHSAKLSILGVLPPIKLGSHTFPGYLMTSGKTTAAYMKVIGHSLCLRHPTSESYQRRGSCECYTEQL